EILSDCVSQAREMQANGDLSGALARVEEVLLSCPSEVRLMQLRSTLRNLGAVSPSSPLPAGNPDATTVSPKSEPPAKAAPSPAANQETVTVSALTLDRGMAS